MPGRGIRRGGAGRELIRRDLLYWQTPARFLSCIRLSQALFSKFTRETILFSYSTSISLRFPSYFSSFNLLFCFILLFHLVYFSLCLLSLSLLLPPYSSPFILPFLLLFQSSLLPLSPVSSRTLVSLFLFSSSSFLLFTFYSLSLSLMPFSLTSLLLSLPCPFSFPFLPTSLLSMSLSPFLFSYSPSHLFTFSLSLSLPLIPSSLTPLPSLFFVHSFSLSFLLVFSQSSLLLLSSVSSRILVSPSLFSSSSSSILRLSLILIPFSLTLLSHFFNCSCLPIISFLSFCVSSSFSFHRFIFLKPFL